jgi:hypothetical protein
LTGDFDCILLSSESLLLLDVTGFFVEEVAATFGLFAITADDFLTFSTDDSESEEDLAVF